jgi:hypothetical protein
MVIESMSVEAIGLLSYGEVPVAGKELLFLTDEPDRLTFG